MISTSLRAFIISSVFTCLCCAFVFGQTRAVDPEWWYGGAVGANFNYYGGDVRALNAYTQSLATFTKGAGTGIYLAPLIEFHPDPVWGGMLHLGYDSRRGSWDDVSSGGTTTTLSTSLSYLS